MSHIYDVKMLSNCPDYDAAEWSWNPCHSPSYLNPLSCLSTKKIEWIKRGTDWALWMGGVALAYLNLFRPQETSLLNSLSPNGAKNVAPNYLPSSWGKKFSLSKSQVVVITIGSLWFARLCIEYILNGRRLLVERRAPSPFKPASPQETPPSDIKNGFGSGFETLHPTPPPSGDEKNNK